MLQLSHYTECNWCSGCRYFGITQCPNIVCFCVICARLAVWGELRDIKLFSHGCAGKLAFYTLPLSF